MGKGDGTGGLPRYAQPKSVWFMAPSGGTSNVGGGGSGNVTIERNVSAGGGNLVCGGLGGGSNTPVYIELVEEDIIKLVGKPANPLFMWELR